MKRIVFFAVILVPYLALAQAPAPAAPVAKPAAEAPKPAAEATKPAPVAEAPKPAAAPKKTRRTEDARQCLEQPDNNAIIKCAEAYL